MITEVTVTIDGALDDVRFFHTDGQLNAYYRRLEDDAQYLPVGTLMLAYEVPHPHDDFREECACVQYLQDHSPVRQYEGQGHYPMPPVRQAA